MIRYALDPDVTKWPQLQGKHVDSQELTADPEHQLEALRATTIGSDLVILGPFGKRNMIYADYTASGRASSIVEDFVRESILPLYGNTHTLATATARQTTFLRGEAREVIRHYFNASHEDALIFVGAGVTAAIHRFVQILERSQFCVDGANDEVCRDSHYREDRWGSGECTLCGIRVKNPTVYEAHRLTETHRAKLREEEGSTRAGPPRRRVVVLMDPISHHSTSLPFRELLPKYQLRGPPVLQNFSGSQSRSSTATQSNIEVELSDLPMDTKTGLFDELALVERLKALAAWRASQDPEYGEPPELVCLVVLAATSNVTGLGPSVSAVTAQVHSILPSALVCWDFAAVAGHSRHDLNPPGNPLASVDVAFLSPHKLWGGPSSAGVLIAKKRLLCNAVPAVVGGGVVFYVNSDGHTYIQNSEEREEAGTPHILGCIRSGLAYHIHTQIPRGVVPAREEAALRRILSSWVGHPRLDILGPVDMETSTSRAGIVSFMVRYGNASPGLYLHYQFVCSLLNDLFGVQCRGGCACAGPYAQWLLGLDAKLSEEFEQCLMRTAQEVLRPGFVRISLHWAQSDQDLDAIAAAVRWVADNGWKLLAAYSFDRETGEWLHRLDSMDRHRVWLSNVRLPGTQRREEGPISNLENELGLRSRGAMASSEPTPPRNAQELLHAAEIALEEAYSSSMVALSTVKWPVLDPNFSKLLWFALPADVAYTLRSDKPSLPQLAPAATIFSHGAVERPVHSVLDATHGKSADAVTAASGSSLNGDSVDVELESAVLDCMLAEEDTEESPPTKTKSAVGFDKKALKPKLTKQLRGQVGRAIADFHMIKEGDRVVVGLSGGKDSLTVLHILLALQKSSPVKFDIAAATVDPMTPEFDPHPLTDYMKALGVKYHMLSQPIIEMAKTHLDPKKPSLCAFCSRMKRGMLYTCMRDNKYNVLVLGQHLDDFAESFFMSFMHNGLLRTMKANYLIKQEDVRVCRPLLYVREKQTTDFAQENNLPIISDNCPACFAQPKERHKTKLLLSQLEFEYPALFPTLLRAMQPLIAVGDVRDIDGVGMEGGTGKAGDAEEEDGLAELTLTKCGAPSKLPKVEAAPKAEAAEVTSLVEEGVPHSFTSSSVHLATDHRILAMAFTVGVAIGAVVMNRLSR